ncbi:MAG TPA: TIR domain-containing protein, partial [Pirellulaceae bacterium]|nr:TIR domain-containing protein [Pirellulaceae bacterium]
MPETNQRVFLSHNSEDKPAVERIAESLRARGVQPWLDKWHLVPGDPWQQEIEEALRTCRACVVFVGQKLGAWQHEEMRTAIDRRVRTASTDKENQFRVIPALLPGAKRGQRSDLPSFLAATTWVEFSSVDDDAAIERLVRGLEGRPARDVAARPDGAQVECPYRGLSAFESEDADLFFGRDAVTDWLLSMLRGTQSREGERRFVALVGASGSGKSSLARAGILAALQRGEIEGSKNWPVTVLRPGAEPLLNLATSLVNTTDVTLGDGRRAKLVRELRDGLREQPDELHLTIASASDLASSSRTRRHVVLVDQFEELFTECKDADERAAFIDNLLHAGRAVGGKTIVLVTMRADFYESCAAHERLRAAIAENQFLLGPMNAGELREAIERPMQSCGGEIEPGLTELLLQDMVGQEQALPLLQHALEELWKKAEERRRKGSTDPTASTASVRRLMVADYRALGGIQGTLRKRADAEFSKLSGDEKSVCREVMVALVNVSDPSKETRRRVTLADLKAHSAQPAAVEAVVQRLVAARLLAASATGADGRLTNETVVEVVHEALIRGWPQLMEWIDENRAELRARQQFHDRVKSWRHANGDRDLLYSGSLLRQVAQWARDGSLRLSADEDEFLEASVGQFVAQLKDLKLERVPAFLADVAPLLERARPTLQRMWSHSAPGSLERTLASVALLPLDGGQVELLRERLVACGWDEFVLVRDALHERRQEVVGWLWGELESAANSETRRFWAAAALAAFEPPCDAPSVRERWKTQAEFVARQLVEQVTYNPAMHARLVKALSPVGRVLAVPLAELAKHHGESQRRAWAANLVAHFAADEPAKLVELACEVEPELYGVLFERLQTHK